MSDYRAIAAMTATLQNLLQEALGEAEAIPGPKTVTTQLPRKHDTEHDPTINIFLYQIAPNPNWRNMELPVRRADGSLIDRPTAALDLHYLFSFYGVEKLLIPQLLLGLTVTTLHTWPYPPPRFVPQPPPGDAGAVAPVDNEDKRLWGSGLLDQVELLRITPLQLNHDELSKLWTIFFQQPYVLSVAYQCTVLLLEPDLVPQPVLPVRQPSTVYHPSNQLTEIAQVNPQAASYHPDMKLVLIGTNLWPSGIAVRVGSLPAEIQTSAGDVLVIWLPENLPVGIHAVQVLRDVEMGRPPTRHRLFESSPASFVWRPDLPQDQLRFVVLPSTDGPRPFITLVVHPALASGQRPHLLLNEWQPQDDRPPWSYTLPAVQPPNQQETEGQLWFSAAGIEVGTYLARIRVDGVTSELTTETHSQSTHYGQYIAPRVDVLPTEDVN